MSLFSEEELASLDPSHLFTWEEKETYLRYASYLRDHNYPIILNHLHLARIAEVDSEWLSKIVTSTHEFYREFSIPKRSGGLRTIQAPYPILLNLQKWIKNRVLACVQLSENAHGFAKNKSIVTNAKSHIGGRYILKVDISDFFPSIGIKRVYRIFQNMGYSDAVCFFLSRICCLHDRLPPGAATSPYISNIVFKRADRRLEGLARKFNLSYSRYADDLTFSGSYISQRFITIVSQIIRHEGFAVNEKKLRLIGPGKRKIVTGIQVNATELRVPKKYKRDLRKKIFYLEKYGLRDVLSKQKESNPFYLEILLGKLSFWSQVEPESSEIIKARKIIEEEGLKLRNIDLAADFASK